MATKTFEAYFTSKGALPSEKLIEGDAALVLRAGTVFKGSVKPDTAYASMLDNALTTTIATVDVWVPINGTLAEGDHSTAFTFAANQYTFVGDNQLEYSPISGSISVAKTGNGYVTYEVGVFVNNVQVGTGMSASSEQDAIVFIQTTGTHILQTGDVIDVQIRCRTDNTDCIVSAAQLNIG